MFWPHIPAKRELLDELDDTLSSRWIGQGPKVDQFEEEFSAKTDASHCLAVNSGTSALHLAYLLAGIRPGSRVISSVFTCTATHHALLWQGTQILFADILPESLNIDPSHVEHLLQTTPGKIDLIVGVHINGDPACIGSLLDVSESYEVPVIFDAAQALGSTYGGRSVDSDRYCGFATCHSFQAIKQLTTGDGGMLVLPNPDHSPLSVVKKRWERESLYEKAKRLRWFGIDRVRRAAEFQWKPLLQRAITVDQFDNGYKYQMTDVAACFGLVGLRHLDEILEARQKMAWRYRQLLGDVPGITLLRDDRDTPCWRSSNALFGLLVEDRDSFCTMLEDAGVETNTVQLRNDIYSVFGGSRQNLPNMNALEERYVYLPLNNRMAVDDVEEICQTIRSGW